METDAAVEIRKERGFPPQLENSLANNARLFHSSHRPNNNKPTSSEINLSQQKNGLDIGVHHRYALDEKVCSFRRTHLRSDFVKRLTFNSGSFHCISDGEDPNQKRSFWRPFNTYFLFIFRSRNSCISDPIRSTSSSNAKWPVSRRWRSAPGISLLKTNHWRCSDRYGLCRC